MRVDGLLQTVARHPEAVGRAVVARLMVLAQLLTYRLDIPQEGRVEWTAPGGQRLDLRLAIMPTARGLRAAVRLPADLLQPKSLGELGLPAHVMAGLHRFTAADAGMMALVGPAGSGKTTTIYALLADIAERQPGLSIIALEDPVERKLAGVTQIEVNPFGELTYQRALKSILRQDPQVLMLGEIRDAATASLAIQAALSGHRLICTLHARDAAGAVARLFEMGLEPYQICSAVFGVVAQRLFRKTRTGADSTVGGRQDETAGVGTYLGRVVAAEFVSMDKSLREGILRRADVDDLRGIYAGQAGYSSMRQVAEDLVRRGITDKNELERVFGG